MLLQAIFHTWSNLRTQRAYLNKHIRPVIIHARNSNDGSLGDEDFKKIERYYGWAVPAVLGEAFCAWLGRKMTEQERCCSTCMGAMTGLFDDFFDKDFLDEKSIRVLMEHDAPEGKASNEKLFRYFFRMVLTKATDIGLVQASLSEVYDAQVASQMQSKGTLTQNQIRQITLEKGGSSLLFYRSAFDPEAGKEEKELLYHLGGLMQVSNDIFDIYKDREAGIQTLATTTTHIQPLRDWFRGELENGLRRANFLAAAPDLAHRFNSLICLGIFSRVFVCLDQLASLEKRSGGTFQLHAYNRKDLICDMDIWANKWSSGRYYLSLIKSIGK